MGLGFWTKLDAVGQTDAVTFPNAAAAETHMAEWDGGRPAAASLVEAAANDDGYASMAACVHAGLPGWLVDETPVANVLPA